MGAANFFGVVLLTAALLGSHAARVRMNGALSSEASAEKTLTASTLMNARGGHSEFICGGDDIWEMLMASSTVRSIQNIKWAKIQSVAGDYLSEKAAQKATLEEELKHLRTRIEEKKAQEVPQETSQAELATLLAESLASFDPKGKDGMKMAAASKCGKPSAETKAPRAAHRTSIADFAEKADLLLTAQKRFNGDTFLDLCHEKLPPGDESYCGPLCQKLKDRAQDISDVRVGAAGGLPSDELVEQMNSMERKLEQVGRDIHRCEKAKGTLSAFEKQVEDLKGVQNVHHNELMDAEYALEDALYDLEDLSAVLEKEQEALAQADEALTQEGDKVEAVKKEIAQAREQESAVSGKLSAGLKKLEGVRNDLEAVKKATQFAIDLKSAVSAVMLKMRLFFDESVLEPLRMMGLDEDLHLDEYFFESEKVSTAAAAVGVAVDKLSDYCDNTARDAFAAVKDQVDLSELCDIGDVGAFKSQTSSAVKDMEDMFVSVLAEEVTGWLDPYHHNEGMTAELAEQRVAEGEAAGFQEIVGVYSQTAFFQYLSEWRRGGTMPALFMSLKTLTGELFKAVQDAEEFVEDLAAQLEAAQQTRDEVIKDLQAAEEELAKSEDDRAQVASAVQKLQQRSSTMEQDIEHLREQVRIAKANCEKAGQALVDALEAVKSGWGKESSLLQGLRHQKLHAQSKVLLARKAVAESRRALLAAQSWAASFKGKRA